MSGKAVARKRRPKAKSVSEAIETERGNLGRAISLLQCLTIALENADDPVAGGPLYWEISQMAVEMVSDSMNALDSINLPEPA